MNRERLRLPPSDITGELGKWLIDLWRSHNAIPSMSQFSGTNPSGLTGLGGHIAVNVAVSSNVSRVWVNTGAGNTPNRTSWTTVI